MPHASHKKKKTITHEVGNRRIGLYRQINQLPSL
jgi:hypothetical protein